MHRKSQIQIFGAVMKTRPWLIVDVSNLAYRNFHAIGRLSYGGQATEVIYGVLRDVVGLCDLHQTNRVVFCFDGGYDKRTDIYYGYKANRRQAVSERSDEDKAARREMRRQVYLLRARYLPQIGFGNVLFQEGYEADDLIASVCLHSLDGDSAIIVSSDSDLYQLLSPGVFIWNPSSRKAINKEWFTETYRVAPVQWADVKALAGCRSDNIPGIWGVGDITAARYLAGNLKTAHKAHRDIAENNDLWERNLRLTRLPFPGTDRFDLVVDEIKTHSWDGFVNSLGMRSLIGSCP